MRARQTIFRHIQTFFETELSGLYRYNEAEFCPAREAEIPEGRKRNPFGKFQEVVELRIGNFDLSVEAPADDIPLGLITLRWPDGGLEGPMDQVTWKEAGKAIRQRVPHGR